MEQPKPKQWWVFTESGECLEASSREEAIERLQRLNTWTIVGTHNVLTEEEFEALVHPI